MKREIILKEDTVLGLNEHLRLRREEDGVILYWSASANKINNEIDTAELRNLPSSMAIMLALFNGVRSLKEIFQATRDIWDKPSMKFTDLCKEVEKFTLNIPPLKLKNPVLIEINGKKKQKVQCYNPESFVIHGDKFYPTPIFPLKFPLVVILMPTMNCFTDCIYCYMGRHIGPKGPPLPFSRWKELLNEIEKHQLCRLDFGGGDPLCYEHTLDMLEIAADFNPHTCLVVDTKAYISPEMARRLSRIPMLEFNISLDSTNPEIADAMVRKKGYGEKAIESLRNLVKAGVTPCVKAVVTPLSIKDMPQTILDLHNLGVYPIGINAYTRSLWRHKDEFFNKADEWKEFERQVKEIQAKHGFTIQLQGDITGKAEPLRPLKERRERWEKRNMCPLGKRQIFILPDGSLIGCDQMPQTPEYFLGNVAKDSLYDVWNSESFKKKTYEIPREKYKGTICYDCKEFEDCHSALSKGYCMRDSFFSFGTIYAQDPHCPYNDKEPIRRQ